MLSSNKPYNNFCLDVFSAQPPYVFHFRVKFYVADPSKLQEEYTRYHFFLQLKKDISEGRLIVPYKTAVLLASYAVQCKNYKRKKMCLVVNINNINTVCSPAVRQLFEIWIQNFAWRQTELPLRWVQWSRSFVKVIRPKHVQF